jgi:hypothetical protein
MALYDLKQYLRLSRYTEKLHVSNTDSNAQGPFPCLHASSSSCKQTDCHKSIRHPAFTATLSSLYCCKYSAAWSASTSTSMIGVGTACSYHHSDRILPISLTEGIIMRIRLRSASGVVSIQVDEDACMGDLEDAVRRALQLSPDKDFNLLASGVYPPRPIDMDSEHTIGSILKDNDLLTLQDVSLSGHQAVGKGPMKRPRKRMNKQSSERVAKSKGSGGASSSPSASFSRSDPTNRVVTLATMQRTRRPNRGGRSRRLTLPTSGEQADLGQVMVSAASGEKGALNEILRDDFKRAVRFRYEEASALARLTAACNGAYSINRIDNASSTSSTSSRRALPYKAEVVYNRGPGHRTQAKEVVDILPEEAVVQALRDAVADETGHGREILRPRNLARQSPRIFWSIVHVKGSDFSSIFATMFPDIKDWTWLTERPRELSAKAMENKRQAEELQAEKLMRAKRRKPSSSSSDAKTAEAATISDLSSPGASKDSGHGFEAEAEAEAILIEALGHQTFTSIVPDDMATALTIVLGDDKISSLTNASCSIGMIGRLAVASPTHKPPSLDQLELWIANAQELLMQSIWAECICEHNENLRRSLTAVGVQDVASFLQTLGSKTVDKPTRLNALHHRLVAANSLFDSIVIHDRSGLDLVSWIHQICSVSLRLYPWISMTSSDAFEAEDFYVGEEIDEGIEAFYENLSSEGWLLDSSSSLATDARIGKEVMIWADEEERYQLPGVVIAYLPPSQEEPMALWKVKVKVHEINVSDSSSSSLKHWFEDLESDEIEEALARML